MGGRKKFTVCSGNIELTGFGAQRKLKNLIKAAGQIPFKPPRRKGA